MTTQHSKFDFGVDDPKFKWGLTLGVPFIPLTLSLLISIFTRCYFFDCSTIQSHQIADYFGYGVFTIGIASFFIAERITKKLYKKGELIWSALDRQNDLCYVCNRLITKDDPFYFDDDKIYCLTHNPFEKQNRSSDKQNRKVGKHE